MNSKFGDGASMVQGIGKGYVEFQPYNPLGFEP
jgi:hypothetical protein